MSNPSESPNPLDRVRATVAAAVAQGLKKKAAVLAKSLREINVARSDGYSHEQILQAILSAGLEITPAYYENLYARESRKAKERGQQVTKKSIQPKEPTAAERKGEETAPKSGMGFSSSADELQRARAAGRIDYSKLIKRKK